MPHRSRSFYTIHRLSAAVTALILLASFFGSIAAADEPSLAAVYTKVKAAAFEVLVEGHLSGSGWFATEDGLAFTAAHVIGQPGRHVEIRSKSAGRRAAEVVAVDLGHDIALLRVEKRDGGYARLPFAGIGAERG